MTDSDIVFQKKGDKKGEKIPISERQTSKYMSKYEKTRILGLRALQISEGSHIMVDAKGESDSLRIAQMELRQGKIPMIIRRKLPDGTTEDWSVDELIIR